MRKLLLFVLLIVSGSVVASQGAKEITVWVDGTRVQFDDTTPVMRNKRVLVPLRGVFQALGATVNWDPATKVITAHKEGYDIELSLNRRESVVNGKQVLLDVPAQSVNDRVVVPLRFVGEALGAFVKWESQTGAVLIQTVPPPLFCKSSHVI